MEKTVRKNVVLLASVMSVISKAEPAQSAASADGGTHSAIKPVATPASRTNVQEMDNAIFTLGASMDMPVLIVLNLVMRHALMENVIET